MKYSKIIFLVLAFVVVLIPQLLADDTIAVVVNKGNSIGEISSSDLKRIFLGEKTEWDGGNGKIFAINLSPEDMVRQKFQDKVIGMKGDELQKYWLDQKIKGKSIQTPNVQKSVLAIKTFVKKLPNAIAYLPLSEVDDSVKILKVNNALPDDGGYILK